MTDQKTHLALKIKPKIYHFITPGMLLCIVGLFAVVYMLRETVQESFFTNVPLNSVIIMVVFYAIIVAFMNNYQLYRTAYFLKRIQDVEDKDEPDHEDITYLANNLETEGALINIQNMYKALENLSVYGHLNFNDNDARLIKSKLGARARSGRGVVNYFAGILVMLGLIGTFWGLLQTIAAVGSAMGEVSKNFQSEAGGGSGGDIDIGEFIGSISAPLQGMGVAFSSSLFGLSGSLFLGFLNFFAGKAQNSTIELVARWIDNRIPQLNPVLAEKVSKQKVPKSDDLKAWLAGFVYLSSKTNQKMGQIMLALSKSTEAMLKSAHQTEKLYNYQQEMYMAIEGMNMRMGTIKDTLQYMSKNIDPIRHSHSDMASNLKVMSEVISHQASSREDITSVQIEQTSALADQLRQLNTSFDIMSHVQSGLVKEIEKLRERSQHEDNITEFTNLVWQLNSILEEIRQENTAVYSNIFKEESVYSDNDKISTDPDNSSEG